MDPDTEVESILRREDDDDEDEDEEKEKWKRPPSSYGSMKSDSDHMEEEVQEEVVEEGGEKAAAVLPGSTAPEGMGLKIYRSESPETLYTMTTEQSKPPGAVIIETRSSDLEGLSEDDEDEDEEEIYITNSPEPPDPIEPEDAMQTDDNSQPGRLHPEQDLPHVFKSIQGVLTQLTPEELYKFKIYFYQWETKITLKHVMDGDILDFVDRILEILGQEHSLMQTLKSLENVNRKEEADKLRNQCNRALIRFQQKKLLIGRCGIINEGVVRAGKQENLNHIFVEPQISTCGYGGVDPSHEFRSHPPSPPPVPSADTFVGLNDLFRLQKDDGTPVRLVLTTGIPGIGMSVCGAKFSLDWAEERANRDFQFVYKLSFQKLWLLRNKHLPPSQTMSIMEVIEFWGRDSKDNVHLEEENCKFLIIMESFECYQAPLDWENAPVINDKHTQAHPDVLVVNIIRGTLLRGARVWILGRRAAVSQIPSQFVDIVTEIQGFSDEMKDNYLSRRFADPELAANIVAHYKRLPTLRILARQPFLCWMIATVFERCYRYEGYGVHPPRLISFYINILIVQTNRRLEFYYDKWKSDLKWSSEDRRLLINMAKMAFKMLESNSSVFFEKDVTECELTLSEVTVFSGLCTELPTPAPDGRRRFCFIHFTFQEFMAALYVFTKFRIESKNVLDSGYLQMPKVFVSKNHTKPAAGLVQCALDRLFSSPPGYYDMFMRSLCGLLSPRCHKSLLGGHLYEHDAPKVAGLDEVQQLLERTIQTASGDRVENLKECLRELIQEDE